MVQKCRQLLLHSLPVDLLSTEEYLKLMEEMDVLQPGGKSQADQVVPEEREMDHIYSLFLSNMHNIHDATTHFFINTFLFLEFRSPTCNTPISH